VQTQDGELIAVIGPNEASTAGPGRQLELLPGNYSITFRQPQCPNMRMSLERTMFRFDLEVEPGRVYHEVVKIDGQWLTLPEFCERAYAIAAPFGPYGMHAYNVDVQIANESDEPLGVRDVPDVPSPLPSPLY
jgi:hypothetical protein